jgi:uncharacterized protein YndB with AHSA1/START domain
MPPKDPRGEPPRTHLHRRTAWSMILALRSLGEEGREMRVAEASAVVPQSPEEVWDLLIGDQMERLVEMPEMSVIAVEDFQMRPDGTARYRVANKAGPSAIWHTADFTVYERPYRSVNRVLESPFGGTFHGTYEPTAAGGTRVSWRWEVEPQYPLAAVMVPMMRPLFARSMQHDLDALAKGGHYARGGAAGSVGSCQGEPPGWYLRGRSHPGFLST